VKKYKISYSMDGKNWIFYQENGKEHVSNQWLNIYSPSRNAICIDSTSKQTETGGLTLGLTVELPNWSWLVHWSSRPIFMAVQSKGSSCLQVA
jgi:hypothetical protein